MYRRWTRLGVVTLLAASWMACSDSTGPSDQNLVDMALDFCTGDAPIFFAYQNEGGAWTPLAADAEDTFRFQATDKVAIAFVHLIGGVYATQVIYGTTDELAPLSGSQCTDLAGNKTLNGQVTGVSPGADAWITMADQTATVFPPPNSFQLTGLPNGPLDLVANRDAIAVNTLVPDRVIVRRGLSLTSGSTIPTLDFAAAEALPPTTNSLSITGLTPGETNSMDITFSTPTASQHDLYFVQSFSTSPQAIYSVPASLTQAGDYHLVDVYAEASSGAFHGVELFYRTAADRAVALGPLLSTPAFSPIGSTQILRERMTLPVQPQYNSFAEAGYTQQGTSNRVVFVTGTSGYFGNNANWTLDMPDLSGLTGYPAAASLEAGTAVSASAQAYGGSAALFFGAAPNEGDALKYAGTAPMSASASVALRAMPGPGLRSLRALDRTAGLHASLGRRALLHR
ncbi:MAG TPA: hypothetical protein VJ867_15175 [Gemmatimonadaceae bacterium]|nr:hypothetical protein [Gemmatimonadaceae bacterium]